MGEATSDYFVNRFDPPSRRGVHRGGLRRRALVAIATPDVPNRGLLVRRRDGECLRHYVRDVVHVEFGVAYVVSAIALALALALVFWTWFRVEGTLSIHSIVTTRRELFYWATVTVAFALGTAVGDFTATVAKLGYFGSGLLFTGLILLPALASGSGARIQS